MPILNKSIIDDGILQNSIQTVLIVAGLIILLSIVEQILYYIQSINSSFISNKINLDLYYKAFEHALRLKVDYYKNVSYPVVLSNLQVDVNNISQIINQDTMTIVLSIFKVVGGIIGLLILNWRLALFVFVMFPLKIIFTYIITNIRQRLFKKMIVEMETLWEWAQNTLNCIEEVKLWNLYTKSLCELNTIQDKLMQVKKSMVHSNQIYSIGNITIQVIMQNVLYIIGAMLIFKSEFSLGGLFAFNTYSLYLLQSVAALLAVGNTFVEVKPSFDRYEEFLKQEIENYSENENIIEKEDAFPEKIVFDNVSLAYDNAVNTIKSVSFELIKGEKVGIIGKNGSGKTSIINLLLRFYCPTEGRILMDNTDISKIDLISYRNSFTVMKQQPLLFNSSISNNIDLTGTMSDEQIFAFCKRTGASKFIEEFPQKLNTKVGHDGSKLSGGQKQKIALTRSLAKEGRILILDEATSNLDLESEYAVNNLIRETYDFDYVIVISHRTEVLKLLDKIILVNKGCIEDIGSYEEIQSKHNVLEFD